MSTQFDENSLGHSLPSDREGSPTALSPNAQIQPNTSPASYLRDNQHPRIYAYCRSSQEHDGGYYEYQYADDSEYGGRL